MFEIKNKNGALDALDSTIMPIGPKKGLNINEKFSA
jgi:hypothetical protein